METDGIRQLGEAPVVVRRESPQAEDHAEAARSAKIGAYREMSHFVADRLDALAPYEDSRPWSEMMTWIGDRIRDAAA